MTEADHPDIVFFLANDWRQHHRPQGRFRAFRDAIKPSQSKVLCVNTPVCLLTTPWSQPRKWREWLGGDSRVHEITDNVVLYTPFVLVHDTVAVRHPTLTALSQSMLRRGISRVLKAHGFAAKHRVSWVDDPFGVLYYGVAEETLRVYECRDRYVDIPGLYSRSSTLVERLEALALKKADVVFCTSAGLYEATKAANARVYLSPNASDTDLLMKTQDPATPVAGAMSALTHPVIGYLGTINEHTDIALLVHVAQARPDWTIVMIGPQQGPRLSGWALLNTFRSMPNVMLTGWLPREELPTYCKAFDVCIIPYRTDSTFNLYVNPDKLHEYTAMGKPVVSTDLPEVQSHKDIIKIATTPEEFVRAIEAWLQEDSPEKIQERLRIARENSWEKRVGEMLTTIQHALVHKRANYAQAR